MNKITTLLFFLLSTPVFAERYICSWSDDEGATFNDIYIRTNNGFEEPRDGEALDFYWEIIHEDESVLVLHSTTTGSSAGSYFYTSMTQIEKNGEKRFVQVVISPMNSIQVITEGECEVVE
ncbi:MAG: hypothetical protein CMM56_10240 [Rhodospirillaceae bacterium]|nr:hypothetical protein [Rhodospirillaceae bacterium]|tara:strand:- start:158 stop:520 length:363 start_codon:yes stop_codon:yes gene_type:complete